MRTPSPDPSREPAPVPWWRHAVVYQIYPRSFADANADGIGDLEGIRSRLSHLRRLGVGALWICPWYRSPMRDGGYDVADYRDIDPRFGTLAHAERLITDAHAEGLKVIVDLVPNHTSSDHPWFQAALAAEPGSPERARYLFRRGRGRRGELPPNNWTSVFGGPAWRRIDDGHWYLHLFDAGQPDLDWRNEEVREEFDDILRFWLQRGVDGFRIDVAHGMAKDPAFPDLAERSEVLGTVHHRNHPYWDRDEVHDIIRRWRGVLDASGRDVMMVAEAWVDPDRLPLYLRPDEFHQSFDFDLLQTPWDADAMRETIQDALAAARRVASTPTWTLSNHDVMRHATRYGLPRGTDWRTWPVTGPAAALNSARGLRRARAAALLMLALPGSAYLYQGEELGLPEVWDLPPDVLDDPVWESSGRTQKGRDGCRVPIPWTREAPALGFSAASPWLPQPPGFAALSVQAQTGVPGSTLELYRAALAGRATLFAADEDLRWLDRDPHVLAFRRGTGARCIVNFGSEPIPLPEGEVVLASSPVDDRLPPDTAAWLR